MRIDGNLPGWQQVYETWRNRRTPAGPGERGPAPGGGDEVAISEAARALAGAPEIGSAVDRQVAGGAGPAGGTSQAAPAGESREERIARLKEQIAAGTYQVDPGRLADRMLDWVTATRRVSRDRKDGPGLSRLSGQVPGQGTGLPLGSGDGQVAGRLPGGAPADPTMPSGDSPKAVPGAGPAAADREGGGAG